MVSIKFYIDTRRLERLHSKFTASIRSESYGLEYATLFIAVGASNYYFDFTKRLSSVVSYLYMYVFVLGTAKKQLY